MFRLPRGYGARTAEPRQVALGFADPRRSYTRRLCRVRAGTLALDDHQDVALHLEVGWDVVKEIVKSDLQRRFSNPKLKDFGRSPSTRFPSARAIAI